MYRVTCSRHRRARLVVAPLLTSELVGLAHGWRLCDQATPRRGHWLWPQRAGIWKKTTTMGSLGFVRLFSDSERWLTGMLDGWMNGWKCWG